jgi:Domain of unknown function (DUF4328)
MSFDPLKWATRVVLVALSLTIAIDLVAVVSDASYHSLVERIPGGGVTPEQAQAADDRQSKIGVVQLLLFGATAIVFILWFFRAYRNLGRLGINGLRWSERWAVGAWFVPLLNFVRPKSIANDIWRGSDPGLAAQAPLPPGGEPGSPAVVPHRVVGAVHRLGPVRAVCLPALSQRGHGVKPVVCNGGAAGQRLPRHRRGRSRDRRRLPDGQAPAPASTCSF